MQSLRGDTKTIKWTTRCTIEGGPRIYLHNFRLNYIRVVQSANRVSSSKKNLTTIKWPF